MIKHCWQWRNNISLAWNRSPIVRTQNGKSHMLTKAKTWGENRMRGIRFRLLLPMASSLGIWLEKRRWNVDAGFVPVLISHFEVEVGRQGSWSYQTLRTVSFTLRMSLCAPLFTNLDISTTGSCCWYFVVPRSSAMAQLFEKEERNPKNKENEEEEGKPIHFTMSLDFLLATSYYSIYQANDDKCTKRL